MKTEKMTDSDFVSSQSTWSIIGLLILLVIFAFYTQFSPILLLKDVVSLFLGNLSVQSLNLLDTIKTALNMTLVSVVIAYLSSIFMHKGKSYNKAALLSLLEHPRLVYITIIGEEVVFRWFFITVLGNLIHATNTVSLLLMVLGNFIFAIWHWNNYKNPADRKISTVFPQLTQGLLYGYLYLRFGFMVGVLTHLTLDAILFSTMKKQENFAKNIIKLIYWAVVGLAMWWILNDLGINLVTVLLPWLTSSTSIIKPNLGIWAMIFIVTAIDSLLGVTSNLLCLDKGSDTSSAIEGKSLGSLLMHFVFAAALSILVILGLSWLISWVVIKYALLVTITPMINALIVCLIITFVFTSPNSGSGIARTWFTVIPGIYISVLVSLSFGFLPALCILGGNAMFSIIPEIIDSLE